MNACNFSIFLPRSFVPAISLCVTDGRTDAGLTNDSIIQAYMYYDLQ